MARLEKKRKKIKPAIPLSELQSSEGILPDKKPLKKKEIKHLSDVLFSYNEEAQKVIQQCLEHLNKNPDLSKSVSFLKLVMSYNSQFIYNPLLLFEHV